MNRFLNWLRSGNASRVELLALEARVTTLEKDERRKRKQRVQMIRKARIQHKWMNNLREQPLTLEERRSWSAGDDDAA